MFQPRGPNFFLSWIMAWKKHRPNTSFLQVTPRTEGGGGGNSPLESWCFSECTVGSKVQSSNHHAPLTVVFNEGRLEFSIRSSDVGSET